MISLIAVFLVTFSSGLQPVSAESKPIKIAVIDSQKVIENSVFGRKAKARIDRLAEMKRKGIRAAEKELEAIGSDFKAKRLTLSEEKAFEIQKDMDQRLVDIDRMKNDADRELQSEFEALNRELQRKISRIIGEVGRENDLTLILESSVCLYYDGAIDISDEVTKKLDLVTE